ncbi:hypothetical protein ACRHK7_00310 [Weissella tructae]|uniref:hypothetical protein n=1 Tax=Weissella tructae TaxID=887702 RepID=UPI003D927D1E
MAGMNLTHEEYSNMGLTDIKPEKFKGLLLRAVVALNQATHRFYDRHDFDSDYSYRKASVKNAIAFQIEYMVRTGVLTQEDKIAQNAIQSQSVGRTSMSFGGKSSGNTSGKGSTATICLDAEMALSGTGLLYAGVGYAR